MKTIWKERLRRHWPQGAWVGAFIVIGVAATVFSFAATSNTNVDFTKVTTVLANKPFSSTISTYGENGTGILNSAAQRSTLGNLKAGYYRVPLQWNGGNIQSSAGGHPAGSGDAWITSVTSMGAEPQIVIGGSQDNNFTPDDAANMVRHFNKSATPNRVATWIIGNEPGNGGMSIQTYCDLFNASVIKMKAVDPTIKVAGPAWAYFDMNTIKTFLQCAGANVDVIDFHHYAMGGNFLSSATALAQTSDWEAEVRQVKQAIAQYVPSRADQIEVQVGEYNWAWQTADGYGGWQGDDRFYQAVNTVWGASVAGHIAKAGGRGHQYADLNGALGLTFEKGDAASRYGRPLNSPMPIYYGLEMFTGGNIFRGFGSSMVEASTTLPDVEIYASNNKNIVMINKSPTTVQAASLALNGFAGGSADVWQTNQAAPFDAPVRKTTIQNITTSLSYDLPPYSVTTFVLNGGQVTTPPPAPAPTPTYSCDTLSAQAQTGGATFSFTTRASAANGATIAGYIYNFGDQTAPTTGGATTQHTYQPGTYTASVTVNFMVNGQTIPVASKTCMTTVSVAQPTPTPPTALSIPIRINVGGSSFTDSSGNNWIADTAVAGGAIDNQAAGRTIKNTTNAKLYQDERWGNFSYHLPVVNGTYTVRLHFAEIYNGCAQAGCRVFNVTANGAPWLTTYDIAAKYGANAAVVEEKTIAATQNAIDLTFTGVTGSAQLAGIEVITPQAPAPTPTPVSSKAIKGIASKCVDNQYGRAANGNKIQLYTCNNTNAQKWTVQSNGSIMNANGYCLDAQAGGRTAGTHVQLYQCNSTGAQAWKVNTNGTITNPQSGLCLDDKHSGTADGTQIWLWTCNGTAAQKWTLTQ